MKNNIIKILCVVILTVCLISGHVCASASAFTYTVCEVDYPKTHNADVTLPRDVLKKYADIDELRAYLFEGFSKCSDERIELREYNIAKEDAGALKSYIWNDMPELFHVDGLRVYNNGTIITAISAVSYKYAENKEQFDSMIAECEKKAAVLIRGIEGNDSLSDVEKALLIHDRLAVNCSYCYDKTVDVRFTMYGALAKGLAVCDGYTRAYSYLLRRVGIDNIKCDSDALNHSWNLVLIDGNYYHVDVTWDDPSVASGSRSLQGLVRHDYFLLSDKELYAKKHDANDYINTLAKSTKYDKYFWQCSGTEFQLIKGNLYYFDHEAQSLMRLNDDGVSGTALYSINEIWWSSDRSYYWDGNYSRLASDGTTLFFSSSDTIYAYNISRNEAAEVFKPELTDGDLIYGFTYTDGYFVIDTNDRPAGQGTRLNQIRQPYTPEKIRVELTTDFEMKDSQTVTADIISPYGVSGYYFGTNAEYTRAEIVLTQNSLITLTVTEPGTYYFVAYDENGESSDMAVITFRQINLHANGGTVECDRILYEENTEFVLPEPDHEELTFIGWTDDENSENGMLEYRINNQTEKTDFYAVWISGIAASVETVGGAAVTITLRGADGNPVGEGTFENGVLVLDSDNGAAFIEVTAPGHIGQIHTVGSFTGAEIKLALIGDSNGDNELDNKDVTVLFRSVSNGSAGYSDVSDVNADGENDNKDVVLLFRSMSDPSVQLIPHSAIMYG